MKLALLAGQVGPGWRQLLGETLSALSEAGWDARLFWDSRHRPPSAGPANGYPVELGSTGRFRRGLAVRRAGLAARSRAQERRRMVAAAGSPPSRLGSRWAESQLLAWQPDVLHVVPAGLATRRRLLSAPPCPLVVSVGCEELALAPGPDAWTSLWDSADAVHFSSAQAQRRAWRAGLSSGLPQCVASGSSHGLRGERSGARSDWPMRVLSVGPLTWAGGYEHAVAAVAAAADRRVPLEYRLIGSGPHADAIAFAAASMRVDDRVSLLGDVATSRIREELGAADVLLQPSLAEAPTPVTASARELGIQVVSTARGSSRGDDAGLYTVPAGSSGAIAEALEALDAERRSSDPRPSAASTANRSGAEQTAKALSELYAMLGCRP